MKNFKLGFDFWVPVLILISLVFLIGVLVGSYLG